MEDPKQNFVQEEIDKATIMMSSTGDDVETNSTLTTDPSSRTLSPSQEMEQEPKIVSIREKIVLLPDLENCNISEIPHRKQTILTLRDGWAPLDAHWKKSSWYLKEFLVGIVVCFTQVPQVVAFSLLAHLDPTVGLHASWMLGIVCALFGGRPAMVNGISGSFAAMIATFIPSPVAPKTNGAGVEYIFPSVIVAGSIMLIFSMLKIGKGLLNVTGSPIMIGFCDGLAIIIAKGQINYLMKLSGIKILCTTIMLIVSFLIMEYTPRLGKRFPKLKLLPSSLLAIVASAIIEYGIIRPTTGHKDDTIGDIAKLTKDTAIPHPFFQNATIDLSLLILDKNGWGKIFYQGFLLAAVGTFEILLVGNIVDGFTKTTGNVDRQICATGLGNVTAGLMSGSGGTAMIGLSTISCLSGGEGRVSSIVTSVFLMIILLGAYPVLNAIPMAALSGIIFVVVYRTFKWFSLDMILYAFIPSTCITKLGLPARQVHRPDVAIIASVVVITILVNLFYAIVSGILLSMIVFIFQVKISKGTWKYIKMAFSKPIAVTKKILESENAIVYIVHGPLFFGSFRTFMSLFTPNEDPPNVIIHLKDGRIYDLSSLEALNTVCKDYKAAGKTISIMNLSEKSKLVIKRADGTGTCVCCWKMSFAWNLGDIAIVSDDKSENIMKVVSEVNGKLLSDDEET